MAFEIDDDDLGAEAESGEYQGTVEKNVQYGPPAPWTVGLPSWIGTQTTFMYIAAGGVAAYFAYQYFYDAKES